MKEVIFFGHLGNGDHLVQNALVRQLAADKKIIVLAKHSNVETCRFQWRDNRNIEVFGITDDDAARDACAEAERHGFEVIRIGMHDKSKTFEMSRWDQCFYEHAGVPFEDCWNKFKVDRQPSRELIVAKIDGKLQAVYPNAKIKPSREKYAFVHDDKERGYVIDDQRLPIGKLPIIRAKPMPSMHDGPPCIFDYWGVLERAEEIHCMESCFAILADHLPSLKAKRRVLHTYTRKSVAPTYKMKWEVL